jgi:hypothetical protein
MCSVTFILAQYFLGHEKPTSAVRSVINYSSKKVLYYMPIQKISGKGLHRELLLKGMAQYC